MHAINISNNTDLIDKFDSAAKTNSKQITQAKASSEELEIKN